MLIFILLIGLVIASILLIKSLKTKQALEDSKQVLKDLDMHEDIIDNLNKAKEKAEAIKNKTINKE